MPDDIHNSADSLAADLPPRLTPAEFARLMEWSRSKHQPAIDLAIPDVFARQARLSPEATAVVHDAHSTTYRELQALAQNVAAELRSRGVGRGDLVGVFCGLSPEFIALILGIWRVGAVYVPLDPKYPSDRLAAIVRDAAPRLIVHDRPLPESLRCDEIAALAMTAIFADPLSSSASADVEAEAAADAVELTDPAVVLYTSGSTGTPKGAVLTHRNLANHNAWVIRTFELNRHDRRTALSSINFDASLEELFCTLNAGAVLVLPAADALDSFARFVEFIEGQRLTAFFLTTSLWRELTNYLLETGRELPRSIRLLAVGGERAARHVYDKFLQVGGRRIRWVNVYGPTETAVYATFYEHARGGDRGPTAPPPIGRPIDNTLLYVLDPEGRLVPPGAEGELYIGGAGVGAGYLKREELNRERFVERPSPDLPPGRYYRTGDQVRFRDDGLLEYVGRLDDQLKLRGFRIEPGEIDVALAQHPHVRDAVTVSLTAQSGAPYLATYVVLQPEASWDERALRTFAEQRLPGYMVPQAFYRLETLPLSPNGKVDRRALQRTAPAAERAAAHDAEPVRLPTAFEQHILDIWGGSLQLPDPRLDDDFFAVGGDSLKAMAIVAKLEQTLQRPIPIATLLSTRTVERLAKQLTDAPQPAPHEPLILLREGDRSRPLFFIHGLAGDVWIYAELVGALKTPAAVFGIPLQGLEGEAPPHADVEQCAAAYLAQIQSVQPVGPYRLAGYSSGGWLAYEIMRQFADLGERVEFLGMLDSGVPLAVERRLAPAPLRRAWRLLGDVPEYLRELGALPRRERLQRIRRICGHVCRRAWTKCWTKRRPAPQPATSGGEMPDDYEVFQWFDDDISFFSEYRLQLIKYHYQMLERYQPEATAGTLQLFRVRRQPSGAVATRTLGWEHLLQGPITIYDVVGTHGSLMKAPHVRGLAAAIDAALAGLAPIAEREEVATACV